MSGYAGGQPWWYSTFHGTGDTTNHNTRRITLTAEQSAGIRARNRQTPPQPNTPEHHYRRERWRDIR